MFDEYSDHLLDSRLREVPLPEGLVAQLREIGQWSDDELDRRLGDVELPLGTVAGIKRAVGDVIVDEQLRDVELPVNLPARLRTVPQLRSHRRLSRWAVAAALMIICGGVYVAAVARLLDNMRPRPASDDAFVAIELPPSITAGFSDQAAIEQYSPFQQQLSTSPLETDEPPIELVQFPGPPQYGIAATLWNELESGVLRDDDLVRLTWGRHTFTHHADDDQPPLDLAPVPVTGGIDPPLVRGFDRTFYFNEGVHPFVNPESHRSLRVSRPPLWTSTAGIEQTRHLLSQGRLPTPADVRVEDFLADLSCHFPAPQQTSVAIRTAAGPAPFGNDGATLLQVGVKASMLPRRNREGIHLILAIDHSAGMRWQGKIEAAREGVRRALAHLEPGDRVSVVAFNESIVFSAEELSATTATADLVPLLRELAPRGGTNLSLGLQTAVSLGLGPQSSRLAPKIVLITDGPAALPEPVLHQVDAMLEAAAADGARLSIIDLGDSAADDARFRQMADRGQGEFFHAADSQQIRRRLVETLLGSRSLVAADVRLQVTFNPQTVGAYRLLGHERTTLTEIGAPPRGG